MIFISPVELVILFMYPIGSRMDTKLAVLICSGQVIRVKFIRKDFGLFWEVLAETGVESIPIKEVLITPFLERDKTCERMIAERESG